MSDGAFHAYVGLLVASALVLSVLAARGFGQSRVARLVCGFFAAVFLGYAGYLVIADPTSVLVLYYVFLAPVYAVAHVVRNRTRRRAAPPSASPEPAPEPEPAPPAVVYPTEPVFQYPPAVTRPAPGYDTGQPEYAEQFGWTEQGRYPAGSYEEPPAYEPAPQADYRTANPGYSWRAQYPPENPAYPPQDEYPAEAPRHTAETPRYAPRAEYLSDDAGPPRYPPPPAPPRPIGRRRRAEEPTDERPPYDE